MQKSTPNALLDWKNHDWKWKQIAEVKDSPTTLLWLDMLTFCISNKYCWTKAHM